MATPTPLAKGLIGLAVIGGMVSAVWNLGLKDYLAADNGASQASAANQAISATPPPGNATAVAVPAPPSAVPPAPTSVPAAPATPTQAISAAPTGQPLTAAESGEKGRQLLEAGNHAQARIFLEQAVKMGDGPAACRLGEMTLKGQGGLAADRDKSASLFQLAQSRGMICFASGQ